jgi:hypothetical protein
MVATDGGEKVRNVVIVKAVTHPPPVALGDDEPQLAQHAQLLRDGAWIHLHGLGELFDATFAIQQRVQKTHPTLRREHAHRLGHLRRLLGPERPIGRAVFERVWHLAGIYLNSYADVSLSRRSGPLPSAWIGYRGRALRWTLAPALREKEQDRTKQILIARALWLTHRRDDR